MFKKPLTTKSGRRTLRSSEVRKLAEDLCRAYVGFGRVELGGARVVDRLFPKKTTVDVVRVVGKDDVVTGVYMVDGVPMFFEPQDWKGGAPIPSVFALWKLPSHSLPCMRTHGEVIERVLDGANLMLPGVITPKEGFGQFGAHEIFCVCTRASDVPMAVGSTAVSSEHIAKHGMSGVGIVTLQFFGDHLCALGPKAKPPTSLPVYQAEPAPEASEAEASAPAADVPAAEVTNDQEAAAQDGGSNDGDVDNEEEIPEGDQEEGDVAALTEDLAASGVGDETESSSSASSSSSAPARPAVTPAEMDGLLQTSFLLALRTRPTFPLPAASFYSAHMLPQLSPFGPVSVQQSTYKKLAKFLKAMEKLQAIRVKEVGGTLTILDANYSSPVVAQFTPPERWRVAKSTSGGASSSRDDSKVNEMQIVSLYQPPRTPPMLHIFQVVGRAPNEPTTFAECAKVVQAYVLKCELVDKADPRRVIFDPHLADALGNKSGSATRAEVSEQFMKKMTHLHSIVIDDETVIRKGDPPRVVLSFQQRANSIVTVVQNLYKFGLETDVVARDMKRHMAVSTTIIEMSKQPAIAVQGNDASRLADMIAQKYGIPKKLIDVPAPKK